jgi:trans-L-3-hydroxyproline dehydratase
MNFTPSREWTCIQTIDAHVAGEPLRVVTGGFPDPKGKTILAKRRYAREHLDHLRCALMLEPRGHADMYGCLLTAPVTDDGDVGVLFMHNEGYSTMCGHGIIGLVKVGLEAELFKLAETDDGGKVLVRIDTPAGRVLARAEMDAGRVRSVSFENVPSFLVQRDLELAVPGTGTVRLDIAYGGAFYALVEAEPLGLELKPENFARIVDLGMRIKRAVMASTTIRHPLGDPDLNFLYGTILTERRQGTCHSRNVCVFAEGQVDRSPTGTGVSARAAALVARGELALDQTLMIESLIGTQFDVRALREASVGEVPAIVPEVTGSAHITGRHDFWIDPADPLANGVLLR